MAETLSARKARLTAEGRWAAFVQRRDELLKQRPDGKSEKEYRREVNSRLNDEFGLGSIDRAEQDAQKRLEESQKLRSLAWRELSAKVPASKRCPQREAYEWAAAHMLEDPANVAASDVPSRFAVLVLLEALHSDEGRRTFLKLHQSATAMKGQAASE